MLNHSSFYSRNELERNLQATTDDVTHGDELETDASFGVSFAATSGRRTHADGDNVIGLTGYLPAAATYIRTT